MPTYFLSLASAAFRSLGAPVYNLGIIKSVYGITY